MKKRGRGNLGYVPTSEEIKSVRLNLTQQETAKLIYVTQTRLSDYENGKSRMHPSMWELLLTKIKDKHGTSTTIP